ncbi:unnamed protein product [Schistocephalus solidus]|uniref:Transposase n=1 Tax=Schistocephalus solidus TaxID=70667 RepID=A0A183TMH8_SCHSO|nr:unnamed protein product [Schistocephalus solidus]
MGQRFNKFVDVNYEGKECATCFKLLQQISEIERDMQRLKMEIEKLKKLPLILPEDEHSVTMEHKGGKRTYGYIASSAITYNKEDDTASTELGVPVKQSQVWKEGNR